MGQRRGEVQTVIHVSHEEARYFLIEYRLGRLSPELSAGVEAHVRKCELCQREDGMKHAPTERRRWVRYTKHLRPTRKSPLPIIRQVIPFVLLILVLFAVGISAVHRDFFYLANMFNARGFFPSPNILPSSTLAPQPTPNVLTATVRFETAHTQPSALAVSPDGKLVAAAGMRAGAPVVVIYDAVSGAAQATLTWPGQSAPGALAWSAGNDTLAACDGSTLVIWQMPSHNLQISIPLTQDSSLRVYNVVSGGVTQTLDARTAFASGAPLRWGADGQIGPAPVGAAGASGVAEPGSPVVSLWQVSGSHLWSASGGGLTVGYDGEDYSHGLLAWSPDERYVLWGRASQQVSATQGSATSSADSGQTGIPTPDVVVAAAASRLAQAKHGDALLWFSPKGAALAMCDRRSSGAALSIYSVDSGQIVSVIPGVCDPLNLSSFAWMPSGLAFLLLTPNHPITLYPIMLPVA